MRRPAGPWAARPRQTTTAPRYAVLAAERDRLILEAARAAMAEAARITILTQEVAA